MCHKPMPGRCACSETIERQNVQPYLVLCENCMQGEIRTQMPGFLVTSPPVLTYNKFGVPDVPGPIIMTPAPPPPC